MQTVDRLRQPSLRDPAAIVAFRGWSDASDAASGAATFLLQHFDAEPFARIQPDEFFNFQLQRPIVSVDDGGYRSLTWPTTEFYDIVLADHDRDLIVVIGDEPHLRWREYGDLLLGVLQSAGAVEAVTLGAFIGQVAHTLPVPIVGVATDPAVMNRHRLLSSGYEGPTGVVGALFDTFRTEGLPVVSLWAAIPHYLSANPNPKAMLALLDKALDIAGVDVDTAELATVAAEFQGRVDDAMEESEDFAGYVEQLESEASESDGERLIEQIEDFLRDRGV